MKYKNKRLAICPTCQEQFITFRNDQKYCSSECCKKAGLYYQNRLEIKKRCVVCGKDFITYKKTKKYCSSGCQREFNKARLQKTKLTTVHPYLRMRFQVLERDNFRCRYCGRGLYDGVKLEIDHIVPKKLNGVNELSNFVTACSDCNVGKSDILLLANKEGQIPSIISI